VTGRPTASGRGCQRIARGLAMAGLTAAMGCATHAAPTTPTTRAGSPTTSTTTMVHVSSSPRTTPSPPIATPASPDMTGQPGAAIPYTVVATNGPGSIAGVYSATSMAALMAQLTTAHPSDLSQRCPSGGCFVAANPPAGSLLILFLAAGRQCEVPTSYSVRLTDPRTLRIDVNANDTCPTGQNGGDAVVLPFDVLLAIPLDRLPAVGRLAIVIYPYGPGFGGQPETGTTTLP
jgi:hypothetical protein